MRLALWLVVPASIWVLAGNPMLTKTQYESSQVFKDLNLEEADPGKALGDGSTLAVYRPSRTSEFADYPFQVDLKGVKSGGDGQVAVRAILLSFPKKDSRNRTVSSRNRMRVFGEFLQLVSLSDEDKAQVQTSIGKAESSKDLYFDMVAVQDGTGVAVAGDSQRTTVSIGSN